MAVKGMVIVSEVEINNAYVKIRIGSINEEIVIKEEKPEKVFRLYYWYEVKAGKEKSVVCSFQENCLVDIESNLYSQAYADLAEKLSVDNKEI